MPDKTVWTCKVADDKPPVRLEDIPAKQMVEVTVKLGASWLDLVGIPIQDIRWTLAMYELCCGMVGVEPKDLTVGEVLTMFTLVEDDRPTMYEGGLPDPKVVDDQTTESSSGL